MGFDVVTQGTYHDIDREEIIRAASILFGPSDHHELRGLPSGRSRLVNLSDLGRFVESVKYLSDDKGVYFTLNPVRPSLGDVAAAVADILKRKWLLIDVDPRRDRDTNASDTEKSAALAIHETVVRDLSKKEWPLPVRIDSGNGYHALYAIDLPNDEASRVLLRECLKVIAAAHDSEGAEVDRKVHNASRVSKLPGTWACKGPHSAERPHRMARLIEVPDPIQTVPLALLKSLAGTKEAPRQETGKGFETITVNGEDPKQAWFRKAIEGECAKVAMAPEGDRNNQLMKSSYVLGGLIPAGLDEKTARDALIIVGRRADPNRGDIEDVVSRGLADGARHPRSVPESQPGKTSRISAVVGFPKDDPWEEPILDSFPLADPFPLHVLPEPLEMLSREMARSIGCAVDFPAISMMAIASVGIGRSVSIRLKARWEESPTLYVALVGDPGTAKSPPIMVLSGPLWAFAREMHEKWKDDKARQREMDADDDPPTLRRITVDDTTVEAMVPLLAENPRGMIRINDELSAFFAGHNQYKSGGKGADRMFYLSNWSGSPVSVDRKGNIDRVPIVVHHPFLSILGPMTTEMVGEMREAKNRDDGMLDRFLVVMPDKVKVRWNRDGISDDLMDEWDKAIRNLLEMQMVQEDDGSVRPYFMNIEQEAEKIWEGWFNRHNQETEGQDFPPYLIGSWAKFRQYCARLALIIECLNWAVDGADHARPEVVSSRSLHAAIELVEYLKCHTRRVRVLLRGGTEDNPDSRAMIRWFRNKQLETFSERDARRNFPTRFAGEDGNLGKAIKWLVHHHCIRREAVEVKSTGRIGTPIYRVNPDILRTTDKTDKTDKTPEYQEEPGANG